MAAVAWALFLGFVWYRTMNFRMLVKISMETIETTAIVLFIVASASIFAWVLTTTQVTEAIAQWVLSISDSPYVFLLLANIFLLFVGCFMETIAAITILVPVFMPIIAKLGIDPVHFGLDRRAEPDDRPPDAAGRHGAVRARRKSRKFRSNRR